MKLELVAEISEVKLTPPPKRFGPGEYGPERMEWKLQAVSVDSQNANAIIALNMTGVDIGKVTGKDQKFKVTIEAI